MHLGQIALSQQIMQIERMRTELYFQFATRDLPCNGSLEGGVLLRQALHSILLVCEADTIALTKP